LSNQDIFGYQELLEKDNDLRSCTVRCLRNNSTLVSIDKNAMISTIKKNPQVLDMMKHKWAHFLINRVSNKLFVEQLNKKKMAQEQSQQ